ncbi:MAG: M15 family metallopeptidase [Dehalococcoidia bacterium]
MIEHRRVGLRRWALAIAAASALTALACGGEPKPPASTSTPAPTSVAMTVATAAATSAASACVPGTGEPDLRVVDKQRGLAASYVPGDLVRLDDAWAAPGFAGQRLRPQTATALVALLRDAEAQGMKLRVRSTFRSYDEQVTTFQYWVSRLGEAQAKRESAPAGHSEHQLGTTADLAVASINWELIEEFGGTPEGKWLAANASRYGFALSYPQGGEAETGYIWEPWHIRYVGMPCATAWKSSNLVLVRFLERVQPR